jgi:hypothetical protein
MHRFLAASIVLGALTTGSIAQGPLATEKDGRVNVHALSCAQLAGTFQEDADALAMYYAGWYNGLAKKHGFNVQRTRALQHEVIVYCKANPEVKVIKAMDQIFKREQARR